MGGKEYMYIRMDKLSCREKEEVWVYFEHVKGLELNVPAAVDEHLHHELEVLRVADVAAHGSEVVTIQQQLPK